MNSRPDRRKYVREDYVVGAKLFHDQKEVEFVVLDRSQRGCRGTVPRRIPYGDMVRLTFTLGPEVVNVEARTQWCSPVEQTNSFLVGLEFVSFSTPEDSDRWSSHLKEIRDLKAKHRTGESTLQSLRKIDKATGKQMSALVQLNRQLNGSHKLEDVLEALLDIITDVIRTEKALVLLEHGGPVPEVAASRGLSYSKEWENPFSQTVVRQVLDNGLPVLSLDVGQDALLSDSQSLHLMGTRSVLCVPLVSGDQMVGVLYLDSSVETGLFAYGDKEIASVIAEMASAAIDRVRYLGMLIQSEKMSALGTMLAGIAHELSGPLTSVLGIADLLSDEPEHEELATMLAEQGKRCQSLVKRLTSLAHPWDAKARPVDMKKVVDSTLPLLKAEFQSRKVELVQELEPELPPLFGDEGTMSQVLMNLLQNALYALEGCPEPKITLDIKSSEDRVWMTVSDNGKGIPPANLTRIFDPYFTTRERGVGTGLGLSLTRTIVEQHGGSIEASNSTDGGAIFRVSLPSTAEVVSKVAE